MSDTPRPTADALDDADLSGRQIGGYRLLRRLGQGAMAEVYLAEQVSLRRQVALKVLRSNLANDATYVRRFDQEARAAAQLVTANIVQIYEVGRVDGVHFIAQEYVQGSNLAELLARRGPPTLERSMAILRQVAAALDKAAQHGIVHRDIKPENIMLAANGEVKVADFGLARLYSQDPVATNLTQIGVTMGTPLYMSPEQVEGRPLDPRSDIYSLGVTAYQMLTGEPPFRGETALGIAVQHLKTPPARLETIRSDLPASVCRIVHKMLAKDPNQRYASPGETMRELRTVSVELFPENAGGEFDDWAGDEDLAETVEARRHATQRLAVAMKTTAMPAVRRRRAWWRWAGLAAACFLVGTAMALAVRPRALITPEVEEELIPRYESAAQQYLYAMMLNDEAAWRSVSAYFPEDPNYVLRANQGLSRLYLQELDFERALAIFNEFAGMSNVEQEYKAYGLAGQAVVLNRLGNYRESAANLAKLFPLRDQLLDRDMRLLVRLTIRRNREALGETQPSRKWDEWFERSAPPAESPAGIPAEDDP
jgi:tRNA A-37 threonylcarbamoyl transferase component Bud32/tetratricopeptide (TPR) repeat protein